MGGGSDFVMGGGFGTSVMDGEFSLFYCYPSLWMDVITSSWKIVFKKGRLPNPFPRRELENYFSTHASTYG